MRFVPEDKVWAEVYSVTNWKGCCEKLQIGNPTPEQLLAHWRSWGNIPVHTFTVKEAPSKDCDRVR